MRSIIIIKKTQKLWGWKTIYHRNKNLIGWAFGHRDTNALIEMYDNMGFEEIHHVYADHYKSYREFFPEENLPQSKKYTPPIERIMSDKGIGSQLLEDAPSL